MKRLLILSICLLLSNNLFSEEYSKKIDKYTSDVSYVITGEPFENLKIISSKQLFINDIEKLKQISKL